MSELDCRLTSLDEVVRISALADPKMNSDKKSEIVFGLSMSGVNNQLFIDYLLINPEICNDINPEVLISSECADQVKVIYVKHGQCDETLARLLTSLCTSQAVQASFDSDSKDAASESLLRETFEAKIQEDQDRDTFEIYLKTRRPFFLPIFSTQNTEVHDHIIGSLVGGTPFTSENFTWPKCPRGLLMQPIVQINLRDAGNYLNVDLGGGLVQVWARQIEGGWPMGKGWPWNEDDENFDLRVITETELIIKSQPHVEQQAPWKISIERIEELESTGQRQICDHPCLMIHSRARLDSPRVHSWRHFGSMYTPRYDNSTSTLYDNSTSTLGEFGFDFGSCFFSEYPIYSVPNPDSDFIQNACYIGGFGGGHGGQNESYPLRMRDGRAAQLLFNYRSEGDSYNAVVFSVNFALDDEAPKFEFQYYRYA